MDRVVLHLDNASDLRDEAITLAKRAGECHAQSEANNLYNRSADLMAQSNAAMDRATIYLQPDMGLTPLEADTVIGMIIDNH